MVSVDTILRAVLTRFIISQTSLVCILELAKHLHLRIKKQTTAASLRLEQNRVITVILEIYGEGLRRKSKIIPSTLAAMAEVFLLISKKLLCSEVHQAIAQTSIDTAEYGSDLDTTISRLGVDGIAYLQTRSPQGVNAEAEVNVSLSIANLILYSWKIDAELIQQLVSDQSSEVGPFKLLGIRTHMGHIQKPTRQLSVNVWNILLLAALLHKSPGPGVLLMRHFPVFVTAYRESLAASSSVSLGIVNAAANINHCYASVKLWLLLERMLSQAPEVPDGKTLITKVMPFVIWNDLWTPFSDLITAYEADVSKGQNTVCATSDTVNSPTVRSN